MFEKIAGSTNKAVFAALTTITTVSRLICPSYYIMQSADVSGVDSFLYRWNHTLTCPFDVVPGIGAFPPPKERDLFGPTHVSDVPFAFGNLDKMPVGKGTCNATKAEHELSKVMRAAWTAMAYGDASSSQLKWPRYNACDSKGVVFEETAKVDALDFTDCQFWGAIWSDITGHKVPFLGKEPSCSGGNHSTGGNKPGHHPGTSAASSLTGVSSMSLFTASVAVMAALVL